MFWFKKREPVDAKQQEYRDFFKIVDKELIYYEKNTPKDGEEKDGYIIFINKHNRIDYVDFRKKDKMTFEERKNFQICLGKLKTAEATPCINLSEKQLIAFKQHLAPGYLLIFQRVFDGVDDIIKDALQFLKQRNMEESRELVMQTAGIVALTASIAGLILHSIGYRDIWFYGVIFGILGSYVSVWSRCGNMKMTGLASINLHILESISRMFIGAIAAVTVMFIVRSGLMLDIGGEHEIFYLYCVFSFAAGFSERFVPSLIEKLINKEIED